MPTRVLRAYLKRLAPLIAEQKGVLSEVAAYGQSDKDGRKQLLDLWDRERKRGQRPPVSLALKREQHLASLQAVGFQVELVPKT